MNDTDPGPEASFDDVGEIAEAPGTEAPLATQADDEYLRAKARGLRAGLDRQAARKTGNQMGTLPPPPLPTPPETVDEPALLGNRDWFPMPETFDSFVGQDQVRLLLRGLASVAYETKLPSPSILLCAHSSYGKRTLAHLYAQEVKRNLVARCPHSLANHGDFAGTLTLLEKGDVLVIEHIDQFQEELVQLLISAGKGTPCLVTIDSGPAARPVKLNPAAFTLICTCDDETWDVDGVKRQLFAYKPTFTKYTCDEVATILIGFCTRNGLQLDSEAALIVAHVAELELPKAMTLLRWIIAYALGANKSIIDEAMSKEALRNY